MARTRAVARTAVPRVYVNAFRRKRSSGKKQFTIPLAIVAGLAPIAIKVWEARGGGASGMAREAGRIVTGFDFWTGQFNFGFMRYGLMPLVGGLAVHWLVGNKLGLNRAIARAGIPFVRI